MASSMRLFFKLHTEVSRRSLSKVLFSSPCRRCSVAAPAAAEKWQLMTAVCLERYPVVAKQRTEMEQQYQTCLDEQELEGSLLADHELRLAEDLVVVERRKAEDFEETEADVNRVMALDLEDLWEEEYGVFMSKYGSTVNSNSDDLKSTDHNLDEKLTLIVRQKLGDQTHWVLPQSPSQAGQSMRESAEHTLQSLCGDNIQAQFMGNAPCGYIKYNYPKSSEYSGAKVFFFKAQYNGGHIALNDPQVTDFLWVKKQDLHKYVPDRYMDVIDDFVLDI